MTSAEFIEWMKGFLDGKGEKPFTERDMAIIRERANSVIDPEELPFNPSSPDQVPFVPLPWITPLHAETRCPKCGIDFSGAMGYVCQDIACPMGAGPIICSNYSE